MALDNIQITDEEKERKRKEAIFQTDIKSNTLPGVESPIVKPEQLVPKDNVLQNINTTQEDHGKITNMTPIELAGLGTTLKAPVINETQNNRRDLELGKMTSSTDGNINTYNIGGNTLAYKLNDADKLKNNISKMDEIISTGVDPGTGKPITLDQINKVKQIKEQANTFVPESTVVEKPLGLKNINSNQGGNLSVSFDSSISPEAKSAFLEKPVQPLAQINRYNTQNNSNDQGMLAAENVSKILSRGKSANTPPELYSPGESSKTWDDAVSEDKKVIESATARRDFYRNQDDVRDREKTRLAADTTLLGYQNQKDIADSTNLRNLQQAQLNANTQLAGFKNLKDISESESKVNLRNLQAQAAIEKAAPKPIVVKVPDGLGGTREEVMIANSEGKYVSGMAKSSNPNDIINSNPAYKKAFESASPEKRIEMMKKLNERLSAR